MKRTQMSASSQARKRERAHVARMEALRPLVLARAGYACERCRARAGGLVVLEAHHRLMRSQGGPDTMENLVCLCGPGRCHGWVHANPEDAYALGLLIQRAQGPPAEPWEPEAAPAPREWNISWW